jgi:hypothetical protein
MTKIVKLTESDLINLVKRVLEEQLIKESDPKTGTGKKPTGSDRRLYTDENPKDTVSVKFRTKQDIIDTLSKDSFKSKSHARQSQIINLIHQRLRVALERAKDPEVKDRLRTAFEYIENQKEKSKKKTEEMTEGELTEKCWKGYTQKGMKTMFGKRYPNCVKKESVEETNEASSPAQQAAIAINMKKRGIEPKNESLYEDEYGSVEETEFVVGDLLTEAEYQGRKVQLGKVMQGDVKKSKVYVKNDKGKVVKVNFGFGGKSAHGKRMVIKKNNPERRKNFRARHNCENPGPRWKPKYWSCRAW